MNAIGAQKPAFFAIHKFIFNSTGKFLNRTTAIFIIFLLLNRNWNGNNFTTIITHWPGQKIEWMAVHQKPERTIGARVSCDCVAKNWEKYRFDTRKKFDATMSFGVLFEILPVSAIECTISFFPQYSRAKMTVISLKLNSSHGHKKCHNNFSNIRESKRQKSREQATCIRYGSILLLGNYSPGTNLTVRMEWTKQQKKITKPQVRWFNKLEEKYSE